MAVMAAKGTQASAIARRKAVVSKRSDLIPVIEGLKSEGAKSLRAIANALNSAGLTTARGGQWTATQVRRVVA